MPLLVNPLPKGPYFGIVAQFGTPADLFHACERVRDVDATAAPANGAVLVDGSSMTPRRCFDALERPGIAAA